MEEVISDKESILLSIKKLLGIAEEYTAFDIDIIININSVFMSLHQLGAGPDKGFFIVDNTKNWSDFIINSNLLNSIKSYVYLKVRLLFDPPTSATAIESINRLIREYEWRINVEVSSERKN